MTTTNTKYTVLIVDDAPENIQVISSILYAKEVNLAIAQSGPEALSIASQRPPDLILLDILMPGMDGFEVCTRLKQNPALREIPIIFLTGKTAPEDLVRGFELGAVDYITKPFHSVEVASRVLTHLELKRSRDLIVAQNQELAQKNRELRKLHALKEQKSEQQYRLLVENVADGIGILQEGRFIFVNTALCEIFGVSRYALLRLRPLKLFREDYREPFEQVLEQAQQGMFEQSLQALAVTKDAREIWIEERHTRIEWEGKPAIILAIRDITTRKLQELALEQEKERLTNANLAFQAAMKERYRLDDLIGKSYAMQEVYELILQAAVSDANVVISGESGTGKELVAWTIHKLSHRRDKAFIPVNCGAIPEPLFESEFFGHRKGAFTGAVSDKRGYFDYAQGGTLFLDEVGELLTTMQVKLLRVLAGGGYTPLGDHVVKKPDVRIIAATNSNPTDMVAQGKLREDFYYRITVVAITLPPLRERREDIPLLVDYFLDQLRGDRKKSELPGNVLRDLYDYDWPGNIRELHNVLQRYLATKRLDFLAPRGSSTPPGVSDNASGSVPGIADERIQPPFHETVATFEKQVLVEALERHHWNRTQTAAALGISRRSLFRLMEKHRLLSL